MKKSIVAFIDILGFSKAITEGNFETLHTILEEFAKHNRNSEADDMHSGVVFTPEISSFSDHIVISLSNETSALRSNGKLNYHLPSIGLEEILRLCSSLFYKVLQSGYLLRGAIAYGELHHHSNIVYGKPLIEAVKAEEELAIHPRIILC